MHQNKVYFILLVACWSCSITVFGVVAPKGPLKSYITGGYKGIQARVGKSELDCSQFNDDFDVLYHLPFLIMINPVTNNSRKSSAYMNEKGMIVYRLELFNEDTVPLSIFCLKNLHQLVIHNVTFPNGIVPDNLGNLKKLGALTIVQSPIVNMTEQLGQLNELYYLSLQSCSLTHLPDFSRISRLQYVYLDKNQLSKLDGLTGVYIMSLSNNLFTNIPKLNTPNTLRYLYMNNNPVQNMATIISHVALYELSLRNTTLSSIPPAIENLRELEYLHLSHNKLFSLPTNLFIFPKFKHLDIRNNLFSPDDIKRIQERFKSSYPNGTLLV